MVALRLTSSCTPHYLGVALPGWLPHRYENAKDGANLC